MHESLKQARIAADLDRLSANGQRSFSALTMRRPGRIESVAQAVGLTVDGLIAGLDEMVEARLISYKIGEGVLSVTWLEG